MTDYRNTEAAFKNIGERAIKTFVEAGGAAVAVAFAGSGVDLANLTSLSADEKVFSGLVVAFVSAGISAVLNSVQTYRAAKGSPAAPAYELDKPLDRSTSLSKSAR